MFPETNTRRNHEEPDVQEDERSGRWIGLLMAVGMLVVGIGLGWLIFGGPMTTEGDGVTQTTVTAPGSEPGGDPEAAPPQEPVAAVAESLLPSVVQIQTPSGIGSGVIYDSEGLILTAAHVVEGSERVMVWLSDGSRYEGLVVGGDAPTDIAVVEVEGTGLPAAPLALDGDIQVGQLAVAIGSPFGLDSTVTSGVVSALNQTVPTQTGDVQSLIQTDAAINPGNSGGALANRSGEVIGINVSIFSTTQGNIGVGFAVPIDIAHDLAQSIVAGEPIERAALGIFGTNAESGTAGALVTGLVEGAGADAAGIEVGDVITSVEGVRIDGISDLIAQLRNYKPGETVTLEIMRGEQSSELDVELSAQ